LSPLIIIFLTVFIDLLGFGIIIPLLPFYAESFGADAFTVGMLGTVYSLMQFVFAPVWGRWSDRMGRRPIILLGLLGSCASYLVLALAGSLPLIFAARVLGGIAGANIPTAQAYIADITTPDTRARGMGMVGAAFGLGFTFGPALGGVLTHLGESAPMWAASGLCFANFIAAWMFLPESRAASVRRAVTIGRLELFKRSIARPTLLVLLVLYFVISMAFSGFEATFALYSERRFGFTTATIGYMFAFIGSVLALVQGVLVGRVVPIVGEARLIPAAVAMIALGLALVPLASTIPLLLGACGVLTLGMGFNGPSLSSMVSRLSSVHDQGAVLGLAQSLASLGRVVGPAWGGFLFDQFGPRMPYFSAAGIMTVAFLVALVSLLRNSPPKSAKVDSYG
jgi:DHA1 family tetracycline resistance protein-like MFS transporter